jgi:hypothetical protein
MQALCPQRPPLGISRSRYIHACPAADHLPARDDLPRSHRGHRHSPRRRPHRRLPHVHVRLSSFCVNLRRVLRIEHLLTEGTCASFYAAASPPAPPSPLCRSTHLHSPMWSHPATIPRDGPGLRGKRIRRHHSCQCHPPETSLTPHVHSTLVAPTGHNVAASVASRAEENTDDDDGDDVPDRAPSRPDVPAGAPPFSPEAATPHAPPRVLKGEALTMAPSTAPMIACEHRRRAAESGETRRAALPNGDQRL